jgi:hypothetical protein
MGFSKRILAEQHAQRQISIQAGRGEQWMEGDLEKYRCGCEFNWSDRFWSYCTEHTPEEFGLVDENLPF